MVVCPLCTLLQETHYAHHPISTLFVLIQMNSLGHVSISYCTLLLIGAFSSLCLHFIKWHALHGGSELCGVCAVLLILIGLGFMMLQDSARTHTAAVVLHQTASTGTAHLLCVFILRQSHPALIVWRSQEAKSLPYLKHLSHYKIVHS